MQVGCAEISILCQYLATSRAVNTATDHGKLMTLVAGKRQSLLIAADDDEVYDKKPKTTEQHLIVRKHGYLQVSPFYLHLMSIYIAHHCRSP